MPLQPLAVCVRVRFLSARAGGGVLNWSDYWSIVLQRGDPHFQARVIRRMFVFSPVQQVIRSIEWTSAALVLDPLFCEKTTVKGM